MKSICATALAAALAIALTPAALAAHGKAGLWEVAIQTGGGMAAMPDMSKMPPQVQAQMRAHGVHMGGNTITTKYCMTAADVANDAPAFKHESNCKPENVKVMGNTYSADVVCTGKLTARGHIHITYSSPVHYSGTQTTMMMMDGRTMNTTTNMDARWVSPDCGSVK